MTTVADFLRAIFPGTTQGYACLVEIPTHSTKTYRERWETPKSTYQAVNSHEPLNINPDELNPTSDWFFSPSIFQDRQRIRDNAESAKVLWVDFDEPGKVNPLELPIRPSMVVETSPGRYHCYWILSESLSAVNVEHINRRLAYHFGADTGGWDANQILRLPIGRHSKNPDAIFNPHIVFIDLSLEYSPADFADIPEVNKSAKSSGGSIPDADLPDLIEDAKDIILRHKNSLSLSVMESYNRVEPDRSKALWFLAHAAYRAGLRVDECFSWLRGSKNDKFSELRRGGEEALWRDVQASYKHAAVTQSDQSIITQIEAITAAKAPPLDKKRKISQLVLQDMQRTGKLVHVKDTKTAYYLQRDLSSGSAETIRVDPKHVYFQKLMYTSYAINSTTDDYNYIAADIVMNCFNGTSVEIHNMAFFDQANGLLYINRYDGTAYLLDGHTVEVVPNGYQNVFFIDPPSVEPLPTGCELGLQDEDDVPRKTDLWYNLIFPSDNLEKQSNSYPNDLKLILMSWVTGIYFKELIGTKPILFMHGPPGSGKTFTFKAIGYTVFGPKWSPYETPSKEETFNHTVALADLNVYDNIDSYVSWLPDKLAQASTSYTFSKRKLYSDGDDYRMHISCFLGLTAFAPKFRRVDVMARMIPVRVVPFDQKMANESMVTRRITDSRRELWRELLGLLNAIIRRLKPLGNRLPNAEEGMRIGDYLSLLNLVAVEINQDPSRAANTIRSGQAQEMTEDDPLVHAMERWLEFPKNQNKKITWDHLYMELCALSGIGDEIRRKTPSSRSLSTRLHHLKTSMEHAGITFTSYERGNKHLFVKTPILGEETEEE